MSEFKKCVFFDRDGIVNVSPGPGYVERAEDFRIQPAFVESLRAVYDKGFFAALITNQQGIGKGLYSLDEVRAMHDRLGAKLALEGLAVPPLYVCPHLASEGCACRKPKPGMILAAAEEHGIDLNASWMVGDSESDVAAGHAAGCRTVLVNAEIETTASDCRICSMGELPALLDRIL